MTRTIRRHGVQGHDPAVLVHDPWEQGPQQRREVFRRNEEDEPLAGPEGS